jgi:hypothetical protein
MARFQNARPIYLEAQKQERRGILRLRFWYMKIVLKTPRPLDLYARSYARTHGNEEQMHAYHSPDRPCMIESRVR